MKNLQESLLDDDDVLLNDTDGDKIIKKKIIQYISDHYNIVSKSGHRLAVSRSVQISDDFTVDILNTKGNIQFIEREIKQGTEITHDVFPTGGLFKWGRINVLYKIHLYALEYNKDNLPPTYIKEVLITNHLYPDDIMKNLPDDVDKLELLNVHLNNLSQCPKKCKVIKVNSCRWFNSLAGMPNEVDELYLISCKYLMSLKGMSKKINKLLYINNCVNLSSLDGLEPNSLKGAKVKLYKVKKIFFKPDELEKILQANPDIYDNERGLKDLKELIKIRRNQ